MRNYKIIITEEEREEIIKAIDWYVTNGFDKENKLQAIKIHLKAIPQYDIKIR